MRTFTQVVEPDYYRKFRCIAAACPDSCCIGWDVAIDKTSFDRYQACKDSFLQPLLQQHITLNKEPAGGSDYIPYALIKRTAARCPFLEQEGLCLIQSRLGESALSATCTNFPRNYNAVDGVLERSLFVSCPEAARLILLNDAALQFCVREEEITLPAESIDSLDTTSDEADKPFRHFLPIRNFIFTILQNRSYPLWQRVLLLNLFCHQLDQVLPADYDDDIPRLLDTWSNQMITGVLRDSMAQADTLPELQLQAMKLLIDHRLQLGQLSESFLLYVDQFRQALGYHAGASPDAAALKYQAAYGKHFQPFMEQNEIILENYLVNYAYKSLFPFGPQHSNRLEQPRSLYENFSLLALHFSLIKTLLIGLAGYRRESFSRQNAADLIQSFAKNVEHNRLFLNQALKFLVAGNLSNPNGMTIMIKN